MNTLDRRVFIAGVGAAAAVAAVLSTDLAALEASSTFEQAWAKLIGQSTAEEGQIVIDLPEIAENGNIVPISVAVESPMTSADYVKAIHVLSTRNPRPNVASFDLTPASGKAAVTSRIRLAETQDVVAIAELSDGRFLMARREIKVTIGGCGG